MSFLNIFYPQKCPIIEYIIHQA
uniref:Uncharacterized protein n=1 Tax=Anguilla anguilla TaxID=7936 RepID=A0A0E9R6B6_ANGAN